MFQGRLTMKGGMDFVWKYCRGQQTENLYTNLKILDNYITFNAT